MFDDDRKHRNEQVPKGLEEVSQKLEVTLWLQNKLNLLDRSKPSKRVESLKSELIERLNSEEFRTFSDLSNDLYNGQRMLTEQIEATKRLQSELDKRPIREIVKEVPTRTESSADSQMRTPEVSPSRLLWFCLGVIGVLIIQFIIYRNS